MPRDCLATNKKIGVSPPSITVRLVSGFVGGSPKKGAPQGGPSGLRSSAAEQGAVNSLVVGSNPAEAVGGWLEGRILRREEAGEKHPKDGAGGGGCSSAVEYCVVVAGVESSNLFIRPPVVRW